MASIVLDNCTIYLNHVDMTGYTSEASITGEAADLDVSTFASAGWREHIQGPRMLEWSLGGPWGFEDPDNETWDAINSAETTPVLTIATTSTPGDVAYFVRPTAIERTSGGSWGDVARWNLTGKTRNAAQFQSLYRGGLSLAKQTITGNTNGTAIQLPNLDGDVNDTFGVFVHVFADNGTSVDVVIERDDNSSFTTATTVTTVNVTGVGQSINATVALLLGNDDYYRARTANLSGTSFDLAVGIGTAIVA